MYSVTPSNRKFDEQHLGNVGTIVVKHLKNGIIRQNGYHTTRKPHTAPFFTFFGGKKVKGHPKFIFNCKKNKLCLGIPSVISTLDRKHPTHIFVGLGVIGAPHSQHAICP